MGSHRATQQSRKSLRISSFISQRLPGFLDLNHFASVVVYPNLLKSVPGLPWADVYK